MAEQDIEIEVGETSLSDDESRQLEQDFAELGIEPEVKRDEPVSQEDEEDRKDDALHADKSPEEREAIRERRRQERQDKKQRLKDKEESYRREIDGLRKQLEEVNTWKNTVEKRNVQSGMAQIDKGISDANEALNLAKQAIAQATQDQDGQALVDAQELYYAARKRAEDLSRVKQVINQRLSQKPKQNLPDPAVINNAKGWMSTKPWYDLNGRDPDSRITITVEQGLAEEGWDPRQQEYWQELDNRLKKYLPHRFNVSYTGLNDTSKGEKPRPPTESSGQGMSRSQTGYRLSPDRVRAIKESGAWDDPAKRREMIKAYMDYDKSQRG